MKNNSKIAIIGAMDCEINGLKNLMQNITKFEYSNFTIFQGNIDSYTIFLSKSGEGKVNAAMNTQFLIDKFDPDYIINTGIAGGIAPNLNIGDIIIGTSLVQYDFDLTALGYAKGYLCTGIKPQEPTLFYSDNNLVEKFEKIIQNIISLQKIHKGKIATGDCFVSGKNKKHEIFAEFNALAVEMEGAAIAQVASANNIPFIVIRTISDLADTNAPISLEKFETEIADLCSKIIGKFLLNN